VLSKICIYRDHIATTLITVPYKATQKSSHLSRAVAALDRSRSTSLPRHIERRGRVRKCCSGNLCYGKETTARKLPILAHLQDRINAGNDEGNTTSIGGNPPPRAVVRRGVKRRRVIGDRLRLFFDILVEEVCCCCCFAERRRVTRTQRMQRTLHAGLDVSSCSTNWCDSAKKVRKWR
jgi:hypothetical protein